MSLGILVLSLLCHYLLISEGRKFTPVQVSKIFESAVKAYPLDAEFPGETLTCGQVVVAEGSKNLTKYYLVEPDEEPDVAGEAAFIRRRNDEGKPWIYIPKAQDHLYKWETQTIVVLKQYLKKPKKYLALMVHFREILPNQFVFEWDMWRPRGPLSIDECPCSLIDKFYHTCENWEYCKLVANVYEIADGEEGRRRRRSISKRLAPVENDFDETETGNQIPKGSTSSLGPFFWDIVDTPEEAFETNARIANYQKNSTAPTKYYEGDDNFPFSGYGDCPFEVKLGELKTLMVEKNPKLLLPFYYKTMRAQCMDDEIKSVEVDILNTKLLLWNTTMACYVLNKTHPITRKSGISNLELDTLELAMHLSAYSFLYPIMNKRVREERENNATRDAVTPFGKKIHRNTRAIILLTLRVFDIIRSEVSHHEVKLTRRLISNLKSNLMQALHNRISYSKEATSTSELCTGEDKKKICSKTKEMFKRDIFQPVALTYFVLFGNDGDDDPVLKNLDSYTKFMQFYQYRIHFLEKQLGNYGFMEA